MVCHRVKAVGSRRGGAAGHHGAVVGGVEGGVEHRGGGGLVEVGGRLVEQHGGPVGQDYPRDPEPGALAAGRPSAAGAEPGLQALGQGVDPGAQAGTAESGADAVVARLGCREAHVRRHGGGEDVGFVIDDGDVPADLVQGQGPHVDPVARWPPPAGVGGLWVRGLPRGERARQVGSSTMPVRRVLAERGLINWPGGVRRPQWLDGREAAGAKP